MSQPGRPLPDRRNRPPLRSGRQRRALPVLIVAALCLNGTVVGAVEPVQAEIPQREAWVGERAPFYVTLYSRGPFSGVASFDLPELPRTVIVAQGSPLIGSESIDEETWLTQRHEFALYTWRQGEVIIPPFPVRFRSKESYTSDRETTEGTTRELRFESRLPPGVAPEDEAIPATEFSFTQSWSPEKTESLMAGDVLERTLTRRATGSTAMMLPPLGATPQEGLRTYESPPLVEDQTDRGDATAIRREILKYQFVRPGAYELPPVTVKWWDTTSNELKQATVPGKQVRVEGAVASGVKAAPNGSPWSRALIALFSAVAAASLARHALRRAHASTGGPGQQEAGAAKRVLAACRQSDPGRAYSAVLDWLRAVEALTPKDELPLELGDAFEQHWQALSRIRYGASPPSTPWSSVGFAACFKRQRKRSLSTEHGARTNLGPLNPSR